MLLDMNIGNIIQIVVIVSSVGITIITLRVTVNFLKAEFKDLKQSTRSDIAGIQTELKQIGEILIHQADLRGEIKVLRTQIEAAEEDIKGIQRRCEIEHYNGSSVRA